MQKLYARLCDGSGNLVSSVPLADSDYPPSIVIEGDAVEWLRCCDDEYRQVPSVVVESPC